MSIAYQPPQRLGTVLLDKGYLTPEALEAALTHQVGTGSQSKLLGEILVELGLCSEDQVVECLAEEYDVPYAKLDARIGDPKCADVLPREYIEANLVMPLYVVRGVLTIAVAEPSNVFLIDEVAALTKLQVQIVAATAKDVRPMTTALPNSKVFVIDDIIEDLAGAGVT